MAGIFQSIFPQNSRNRIPNEDHDDDIIDPVPTVESQGNVPEIENTRVNSGGTNDEIVETRANSVSNFNSPPIGAEVNVSNPPPVPNQRISDFLIFQRTSTVEATEEQLLIMRRQSAFFLVVSILLMKLWIEAFVEGDFGVAVLYTCVTAWLCAVVQRQRARFEGSPNVSNENLNSDDGLNDDERMLGMSYQTQLSMAIWESRMLAMMGGISDRTDETEGLSEESRKLWKRFSFTCEESGKELNHLNSDKDGKGFCMYANEDHTCSICLCDYEDGDELVRLPCGHIYHDDCVSSWTKNHVRCPLCNHNLEDEDEQHQESHSSRN